jgi:hypothetical protein
MAYDNREQYPLNHTCHARGCETPCKPEMLMCGKHWRMVPAHIQRAVYKHYRAGQCDDKKPSRAWHDAADAAIKAVSAAENKVAPEQTNMFSLFGESPEPEKKGRLH